jgi:hypothetical protein
MPARRPGPLLRSALVLFVVFMVIVQSAAPAWAWGRIGYRIISRYAERHLTDWA